jgi:hypothetical protein
MVKAFGFLYSFCRSMRVPPKLPKSKLIHAGILLGLLLLSGCATQPRQPVQAPPQVVVETPAPAAQQKADIWRGILDDSSRCIEQVYEQPDAAPIRARRPLDILTATHAQLNNRLLASATEIKALEAMYPRLQACRHQLREAMEVVKPSAVPTLDRQIRDSNRNLQALVARRETWGAYIRQEQADVKRNRKALGDDGQPLLSDPVKQPS